MSQNYVGPLKAAWAVLLATSAGFGSLAAYHENWLGALLIGGASSLLVYSVHSVGPDQIGVLLELGRPISNLTPGLYFVPPAVYKVWRELGTVFQRDLPPIHVKFGQPDAADTDLVDDPYNLAIVAEVRPVFCWRIASGLEFLQAVGSVENCQSQLASKVEGIVAVLFSTVTPAKASKSLAQINATLRRLLEASTTELGIVVTDAYVKPIGFGGDIDRSVVAVSVAGQSAKATKIIADAEREKRVSEGAGAAEAVRLMLEAEALGIGKLAVLAGQPEGKIVLWMQTLAKALAGAQYSIVPGTELFAAFTGIAEALRRQEKKA